MNIALLFFYMLLMNSTENAYQQAAMQANMTTAASHEAIDSFSYCDGKIKSFVFKDSVLNKPGQVGTEYNYPLFKFETEIVYYKNNTIASFVKREIHLKRYEYGGVTIGIQITATLDSLNTFYFDQEQQAVNHTEFLKLQSKICRIKD